MEQKPQCVLVIVSNKSTHWNNSWSSSEELLPMAFDILKHNQLLEDAHDDQPELKLLAKQGWEIRSYTEQGE